VVVVVVVEWPRYLRTGWHTAAGEGQTLAESDEARFGGDTSSSRSAITIFPFPGHAFIME